MFDFEDKKPKVLVIGDLMIDHYLWGSCNRLSPEAPVQVIDVKRQTMLLGGAGNVLRNLVSLGAEVDIYSVIGDCENAQIIVDLFNEINIDSSNLVREKGRISSKKSRIIASNQQVVRYDQETSKDINKDSEKKIFDSLKTKIDRYDVVLLSDYGKGVLTKNLTSNIINYASKLKIKVLVDPKGRDYSKYKNAYLITPNKKEASEATGINIVDDVSLTQATQKLKHDLNLAVSVITLSEQGISIYEDSVKIFPTVAREVFDVTGAGDTVLAALGFALACQKNINDAVNFANIAAGVVVKKLGSATSTLNEINEYISLIRGSSTENRVKNQEEIKSICLDMKSKGKRIVFTNGCFDILHIGHIKYLEEAKKFGDILIVGINSDYSVKKLKGDKRPINHQDDRAHIIAALKPVDYVVIFDEETPYNLISILKPNTLVKGGDYKEKRVIGQDLVDELKIVNFVKDKSTTITISKILNS